MATSVRRRRITAAAAGLLLTGVVIAFGDGSAGAEPPPVIDPGDGGDYEATLDPDDVVDFIDNPYLPLLPGARWEYIDEEEGERIEVVVTDQKKKVMGIDAVVVRDTVTVDGELVEDTYDWFAQDSDGNVWYLGEDSTEYEDGEPVSTEGSWEAGVDGAQPGIVMLANPEKGDAYRQEYDPGNAEDMAEVRHVDATRKIDLGTFDDVLVTWEWTPLEPDVVEEKSYAPGVGLIQEVGKRGSKANVELIEFTAGSEEA